jgi:hypothetical protein
VLVDELKFKSNDNVVDVAMAAVGELLIVVDNLD